MPKATNNTEISQLRRTEAEVEAGSRELDRLATALLDWPRHIVVMGMPPGTWADLPSGWQTAAQLWVTPQRGGLPGWRGGPVAVSLETARAMLGYLEEKRRSDAETR